MSSICAEQHKFHSAHQLFNKKTLFREVDIPPRKLLNRRPDPPSTLEIPEMFTDSPKISMTDETLLQKFLPYNTGGNDDDDNSNPYSSDHFRMFEFKVRRCTRSRSHDWTDCPFAHPGEKARRRDPRRYHYSGTVCSEYRHGGCSRGDNCEFAHGVFECWLHPARYRTEACKDGKHCKRKVCFFAHTPRQLRVLPQNTSPEVCPVSNADNQYRNIFSNPSPAAGHCCTCIYCTHCTHNSVASSPTSTLMGISHFSPPGSPPLSPVKAHSPVFSPISRFSDRVSYADSCGLNRIMSYKDVLIELMTSLEAMNVNEASPENTNSAGDLCWADVSFNGTTPNPSLPSGDIFSGDCSSNSSKNLNGDDSKLNDPDLGWVNELLM